METTVTINNDQKLYMIPFDGGYSCLGFQVTEDLINRIVKELGKNKLPIEIGTIEHYNYYRMLCDEVATLNKINGFRSNAWLNPKLTGLEGKRVEVKFTYEDEPRKFYVGKSTGYMPCHLEIKSRNSGGGGGVTYNENDIESVRVIGTR